MLVSGKMINNMVLVKKLGLMVHIMRDNMKKERNMGKGNQFLLMDLCMKVNLIIMIFMVVEYMFGLIIEDMKENGKEIRCMEKELLLGLMEDLIMESIII